MSHMKIDMRLVAQGYDQNRNGMVDDELKINAPGLAGSDGHVSVDSLAGALGADRVIISSGAVLEGQPGQIANLPEINSMKAIHNLAGDAVGFFGTGNSQYPGWRYQDTYTDSNGYTRTSYRWGSAITDLRVRLESIYQVASNAGDFRSKTVATMARTALNQNSWDYLLDNGTAQSRYAALFAAIQNIYQVSETPPQPADAVGGMFGAVSNAQAAVSGFKQVLADPGTKDADARSRQKAADERKAAASIPWWHFLLLFGFWEKSGHLNNARRIEDELATLKAANPAAFDNQLSDVAKSAYQTSQAAWAAKNMDDAQALANNAAEVNNAANGVKNAAAGQSGKIQDLLRTIG